MHDLKQLVKKNLHLLFRSKTSFMIFLLGPLLLVLLAGLAFDNTQSHSIKVGYFEEGTSTIREPFMGKLVQNNFKHVRYSNEDSCVKSLKEGKIQACLAFRGKNELTIFADYTKFNFVWEILNRMSSQISLTSSELSLETAKNIVQRFEFACQ